MTRHPTPQQLGPPSLEVGGLELWVHGREFPGAQDADDGNWLRVSAHCGAPGSSIWTGGAILSVSELVAWSSQCERVHRGELQRAVLRTSEPVLSAAIERIEGHGPLSLRVEISLVRQKHSLEFELEPSELLKIVRQCSAILERYPVRGAKAR